MKHLETLLASLLVVSSLGAVTPAAAQTTAPTVILTQVDPTVLATGYRASKIIGSEVFNDEGAEIGTVEDMIVTENATVPYAVVSVGGFLGMNAHHVVVAASAMQLVDKKLTLHGATKESLKALPNFTFAP